MERCVGGGMVKVEGCGGCGAWRGDGGMLGVIVGR